VKLQYTFVAKSLIKNMKTITCTLMGAAMLILASCGPNAEQVEQQKQDSIRVADSTEAARVAEELENQRIQDSIAAAEAAAADTTAQGM
jgi:hypothetical protein